MRGFGSLQSVWDLREKLEHDFRVLKERPADTYAAYNFFVTAEHLLDWLYPGDRGSTGAAARKTERETDVLLRIVHDLANGAKHFELNPERHDSVVHVDHSDYGRGSYGTGPFGGDLIVSLDGDAASQYGASMSALDLARNVHAYWQRHPEVRP